MNKQTFESVADVEAAAQKLRDFHATGTPAHVPYRREALVKMKAYLKANEERILKALRADLGKSRFEGYATELGIVYDEINTCLKHLNSWTRPRRVASPIVHFRSSSKVYPSPLGVVLVLSPWNYPLQLALVPMVDAIAAGNCVALKPRARRKPQANSSSTCWPTSSRPNTSAASPIGPDERLAAGGALGQDLLYRQPERGPHHHGPPPRSSSPLCCWSWAARAPASWTKRRT